MTSWYSAPAARTWTGPSVQSGAHAFHRSLPGYAPTPLVPLPGLAAELGVGRVLVKDESSRLGLPAFKVLGASWACSQVLEQRPGATLVTATDGNHGRAVARMARLLGLTARVFVPDVISERSADAIAGEGAHLERVDGDYDRAVGLAATYAAETAERRLVQDTAWPGYEDVPGWIVEGYRTILLEIDEQLAALGAAGPDLVAVPVGVGSLLQAVLAHYRSGATLTTPAILSVEPDTAACLLASLRAGAPTTVETDATVMAGLNCGTISSALWPYARDGLDAAVAITDADALRAVTDLAGLGISSGPSGAASLAGARAALAATRRAELGMGPRSTIVLLSTEAAP